MTCVIFVALFHCVLVRCVEGVAVKMGAVCQPCSDADNTVQVGVLVDDITKVVEQEHYLIGTPTDANTHSLDAGLTSQEQEQIEQPEQELNKSTPEEVVSGEQPQPETKAENNEILEVAAPSETPPPDEAKVSMADGPNLHAETQQAEQEDAAKMTEVDAERAEEDQMVIKEEKKAEDAATEVKRPSEAAKVKKEAAPKAGRKSSKDESEEKKAIAAAAAATAAAEQMSAPKSNADLGRPAIPVKTELEQAEARRKSKELDAQKQDEKAEECQKMAEQRKQEAAAASASKATVIKKSVAERNKAKKGRRSLSSALK